MRLLPLSIAFVASTALGEVGDPTIRTSHPHYPGEGAFQSVEDCVRFATAGLETGEASDQDRAIALFKWLLTHQYHLMSPQEWCVTGRVPDTAVPGDYELIPFDANRARFSYGYGLCGTVHAWNEPYWAALGMRARRRAFPGHVNSEVRYGGTWHAFDTDMAGLLFRKDGVVAGYDDIIRDPGLVDSVKPPLPHYPFAWPSDFEVMKKGWQEVARTSKNGQSWYSLYNSGYAAHPGIVRLRTGESFTRWFDRDHFGGPAKRRFWHNLPGGPRRNWTFLNNGDPVHEGPKSNSRSDASYANAEFVYEPPLDREAFREGTAESSDNLGHRSASPRLHSTDGQAASVTFRHFSPYVICGDPVDDANPMTGRATDGAVVAGRIVGRVKVAVSANEGLVWQEVAIDPDDGGRFRVDLTDRVKGRYGWQIRFSFAGDDGVDELRFTTVTQVAQGIYPRLTPNGCEATYRTGSRGVTAVLPDFGLPEETIARVEDGSMRSKNVAYKPRGKDSRLAYRTTDNRPGQVVFRVEAPRELLEVRAAVRYQLRVPPPERTDYRLEVSTDAGRTWREFAKADVPADNEFSSGWLSGRVDVSKAGVRQALVRVTFHADGYPTGLIDAQFYGVHRTDPPRDAIVEFGWREEGRLRTHAVEIGGDTMKSFTVPTGEAIVDDFVRISVPVDEENAADEEKEGDAQKLSWVEPMRKVHAGFEGNAGYVAQFGDSITYSMAFWSPIDWDEPQRYLTEDDGLPKSPRDGRWRDVVLGERDKGPKHGNYSGWTVKNLLGVVDDVLERNRPEMAIIMIGTNDVSGGTVPESYAANLESVVAKCLDAHCIPILNTIPPRRDREKAVGEVNRIVRDLAKRRKVPLVDYHAEIVRRRPDGTWQGTLISDDGVHPTAGKTNVYTEENLATSGYALRNWLNFLAVREVYFRVLHPVAE